MTGDCFLVVRKVLDSTPAALVAAGLNLLLCLGLWFGSTLVQRTRRAGLLKRMRGHTLGPSCGARWAHGRHYYLGALPSTLHHLGRQGLLGEAPVPTSGER